MVTGIQLVGIIFGLVLTYFTFLHYKRDEFSLKEFLGWQAIWVCFLAITLFPNTFYSFNSDLGILRPLDLYTILGFIVVMSITFYNYVNVDRLRKQLEKAIRDLALKDFKQDQSKK
ncbi:MAG: DUF2304 domain-containing protein [bacterium]